MKTVLIVTAGVAGGLIVANILTDGAVMDAMSDMFSGIRSKLGRAAETTEEVVSEVVEEIQ